MVSAVQSSAGSSAYVKSAQLGGNAASNRRSAPEQAAAETRESPSIEKSERTSSTSETREASSSAPSRDTQLETRNDAQTLTTEQTRGSLLDLAV